MAVEKLQNRYGLKLGTQAPRVPYRETIRKACTARGRHKRQSGSSHGQFGDVLLEIAPGVRGAGLCLPGPHQGRRGAQAMDRFGGARHSAITLKTRAVGLSGGGCDGGADRRFLSHGGFLRRRVPDRRTAGDERRHAGLRPGAAGAGDAVLVHVPTEATAKVNGLGQRAGGRALGYGAREGWRGWDTVRCEMPLAEISDLIVDLRSLTQGVGTYEMEFDRLVELDGASWPTTIVATRKGFRAGVTNKKGWSSVSALQPSFEPPLKGEKERGFSAASGREATLKR